ncbi:MAG: APA family basic amino acid/polyamine antiporter [Planctomycetota bacterium]|jgi:APA family basic amino acid/polyamine antiporter
MPPGLRRDLGRLESYALLVGILVGAGIFRVTSDATALTGPSVILAHLVLTPVILATAVSYLVFLSTPLGLRPGGEIAHIAATLGNGRLVFLAGWLKLISYMGACAYLADALARNVYELFRPGTESVDSSLLLLSLPILAFFCGVHLIGVRWFGRVQVAMCMLLAVALVVLIVPGVFAIDTANYKPFFYGGASGFGAALPPLFFAYAGFEALSQAAGEVRDSRKELPRIFVRGIVLTALIFLAMSSVALGVLPSDELGSSGVPMSRAAATYLPFGAEAVVTVGAIMAIGTSLNASLLVPARLAYHMAHERQLPQAFGRLHVERGIPVLGLVLCFVFTALLLASGQMGLALGIAVVSLMMLYVLHSLALCLLPRLNPDLYEQVETRIPRSLQCLAAGASILALLCLIGLQFSSDIAHMQSTEFSTRWHALDWTSLELVIAWLLLGFLVHAVVRRTPPSEAHILERDV